MEIKFTVQTKINKPLHEVFDAVINPKKLTGYFAQKSSGPLVEGQSVVWSWSKHEVPVAVKQVSPDSKIVLQWEASGGAYTTIEMSFTALEENKTMIAITESGWQMNEKEFKGSYENCQGWQHMTSCMKAYLEHGIDLR